MCNGATINAQGANITAGFAISVCNEATINLQRANINAEYAIGMCTKAKMYYDKSTNVPLGIEGLTYECKDVSLTNQNENSDNNNNGDNTGDGFGRKNNDRGQSISQKLKGFVKKHPVISIGALVTVTVVTPLVIFRNKIIEGIKSIFGKNQNKKPIAKRIKITN